MPITYVNAKGKTYYLHQGVTKTGKPKYHFAMKSEGNLVDSIPEGCWLFVIILKGECVNGYDIS